MVCVVLCPEGGNVTSGSILLPRLSPASPPPLPRPLLGPCSAPVLVPCRLQSARKEEREVRRRAERVEQKTKGRPGAPHRARSAGGITLSIICRPAPCTWQMALGPHSSVLECCGVLNWGASRVFCRTMKFGRPLNQRATRRAEWYESLEGKVWLETAARATVEGLQDAIRVASTRQMVLRKRIRGACLLCTCSAPCTHPAPLWPRATRVILDPPSPHLDRLGASGEGTAQAGGGA
jgi:hypothetical protein